ncbi:MAG: hypothetical protein V1799_00685 [bacterium]
MSFEILGRNKQLEWNAMSLSNDIANIINTYTLTLVLLSEYVKDIGGVPVRGSRVQSNVPKEMQSEFDRLLQDWKEHCSISVEPEKSLTFRVVKWGVRFETKGDYSKECIELFRSKLKEITLGIWAAFYYPQFLYDMALVQAITVFEAFLEAFLIAVFSHRPNILKSGNTLTYEEILSFSSMQTLIAELATVRAKRVLDDGIDKAASELKRTLSVDINRVIGFEQVREACYRRNVIVHNQGIADRKYCERIPGTRTGVKLSTTVEYLEAVLSAIGGFIDDFDRLFSAKLKYGRDESVNRLLHPELIVRMESVD